MGEGTTGEVARRRDAVLAIDIGASSFSAGLVTARGELIDRATSEIEPDVGPQSHFAALASVVLAQRDQAVQHHGVRIRAIGVGSAGAIDHECRAVSPAHISAWRAFPLAEHLRELIDLPVYGDIDAKALALAEGWLGAARGVGSFATMIVSSAIGGGFVIDGELLEGRSGNAGQIGHVIVEPGGRRCRCGARGCLDAEASGTAIEAITGRRLDEPSYDIMRRTGRLVGRAAGMVCSSLDLDVVVVGGTVAESFAATFYNAAQEEIDAIARVGLGAAARITPSRLGDRGPLIGAGAVGWRGLRRAARTRQRPGNGAVHGVPMTSTTSSSSDEPVSIDEA
jgi:glucokinase